MHDLGYTKPLYILPFDHRATFVKQLFGIEGRMPSNDEINKVKEVKQIIYEGFKKAIAQKVPKEFGAIFAEEQFSDEILKDSVLNGYVTVLAVEKSGQKEFEFEYGDEFASHIEKYKPTFAKALIRYNPDDDLEIKKRQQEKLKLLSDYCHQRSYKFLLEPLVPATVSQLAKVNNEQKQYDETIRPDLTVQMIRELQAAGVEPDVWKLEGVESKTSYISMVKQIKIDARDNVNMIILGRGADKSQVEKWLLAGKGLEGVLGFAVGRTIFWDPLINYKDGKIDRTQTIDTIAKNYIHFYTLFTQ